MLWVRTEVSREHKLGAFRELLILSFSKKMATLVKIKNQLDATKYAVLLPQHVSGTNMPIIVSTINK
jgi:hypothetical protein